jgi:predicted GNAT superfamily acetyltransferase
LAGSEKVIDVRSLANNDEIKAAVALQKSIWGFDDIELLPVRLFVTAQKIGGQAFGAFDADKLVGFGLAIPGVKPGGGSYLHSHIVGVAPEYRDYGIGRMMKLWQRDEALARGLALMEWTFDPLEIKNAYFNLERLGAIVRRFVRNQYGVTSSHLHGGLPTDRCIAEWWLSSERVTAILAGSPLPRAEPEARIAVPIDIAEIRTREPKRARGIQSEISAQFERYFQRGLAVIGFERTPQHGAYLLAPYQPK